MKWYKANNITWQPEIYEIEIEKFTDGFVWIGGRRHKRITSYDSFFPSYQEATGHCLMIANADAKTAQKILDAKLNKIRLVEELIQKGPASCRKLK